MQGAMREVLNDGPRTRTPAHAAHACVQAYVVQRAAKAYRVVPGRKAPKLWLDRPSLPSIQP